MAKVVCPVCRGRFHETTDLYRDDTICRGDMLSLMEPYRTEYGWTSFPEVPDMVWANLDCPQCGSPYINDQGRVELDEAHIPTTAREVGLAAEYNNTLDDLRAKKEQAEEEARQNDELMQKAIELWQDGKGANIHQISKELGVPYNKVTRLVRLYNQTRK